jgi:2-hydroxychromene-2-carboxylate isomerase
MKTITFYFDVISPYAALAFARLPEALVGISHEVVYKPVLFAGMLKHFGQLGPAEIPVKKAWTFRQINYLARSLDVPLQMPAAHPFNPLSLLRLCVATSALSNGSCKRYVAERAFNHVWQGGLDAADALRLQALVEELEPKRPLNDPAVKAAVASNTQEAIDVGCFGVPSMVVDGRVFWGLDALPMLREHLKDDPNGLLARWEQAAALPDGVQRSRH